MIHTWTRAGLHICSELYRGISASPFPEEVAQKLDTPLNPGDIEIKSDGKAKYHNKLQHCIVLYKGVSSLA